MCGRVTSYTPAETLAEIFDVGMAAGIDDPGAHWNMGPTSTIFGITAPRRHQEVATVGDSGLVLDTYRWGLIPSWASSPVEGSRLFNARAETVADKPAFRRAFKSRRLVVVVDGFYEWRKSETRPAEPFYFRRADGYPLTFAGLWEPWRNPADGNWLHSCTIITTSSGPDMDDVHDRMPVILEPDGLAQWLEPGEPPAAVLAPAPAETLYRIPVGSRVGSVKNDDPSLIERVEQVEQAPLF